MLLGVDKYVTRKGAVKYKSNTKGFAYVILGIEEGTERTWQINKEDRKSAAKKAARHAFRTYDKYFAHYVRVEVWKGYKRVYRIRPKME
jgi:hypothetical protein